MFRMLAQVFTSFIILNTPRPGTSDWRSAEKGCCVKTVTGKYCDGVLRKDGTLSPITCIAHNQSLQEAGCCFHI